MTEIPVCFQYNHHYYVGEMIAVNGDEAEEGKHFQLFIDGSCRGQLTITEDGIPGGVPGHANNKKYNAEFTSQTGEFKELADFFADVVMAWRH